MIDNEAKIIGLQIGMNDSSFSMKKIQTFEKFPHKSSHNFYRKSDVLNLLNPLVQIRPNQDENGGLVGPIWAFNDEIVHKGQSGFEFLLRVSGRNYFSDFELIFGVLGKTFPRFSN